MLAVSLRKTQNILHRVLSQTEESEVLHYCYSLLLHITEKLLWIKESNQVIFLIISSRISSYSTNYPAVRKHELTAVIHLHVTTLEDVPRFH
jgi:hypothetical protein